MNTDNDFFTEGGHLTDDAAALYADALAQGELPGLPEQVLEHVEECSQCKDSLLELSIFLRNPDSVPAAHLPAETQPFSMPQKSTSNFPLRTAAVFFLAALMVSVYFVYFKDHRIVEKQLAKSTTTPQIEVKKEEVVSAPETVGNEKKIEVTETQAEPKVETDRFAGNFPVNPSLENMIGSRYRSAVTQIISPRNGVTVKGNILFAWKRTAPGQVTLKIINNKGKTLYAYDVKNDRLEFKDQLLPGLYYWKLENREDLLYIGKFFVR